MSSASTYASARIEPTLYPTPGHTAAVVDGTPAVRRQRLAIERALRSDRPFEERAMDIAVELIPDTPDFSRSQARTRAVVVLATLMAQRDIQTALELATAVQAHIEIGSTNSLDLYPMQGRLLLIVFSARREPDPGMPERRRSRAFSRETVAA